MQVRDARDFRKNTSFIEIWLEFRRQKIALFSFYLFLLLTLTAVFADWLVPYSASEQFIGKELLPPSWAEKGQIAHFFGTDDLGRDLFSRLILGTKYSLGSSLLVVLLLGLIGGLLALMASMSKGVKALFLGHIFDVFLSIPSLLIAIIISTFLQPSLINAIIATLLAMLPYVVHSTYQAIQLELKKDYIQILRLDGISQGYLLRHIILPNIMPKYIEQISQSFAVAMLDISALGFISLGAQRPMPEWGAMIKDSLELISLAPWTVWLPGLAIMFTILLAVIFTNGLAKAIHQYYD